MGTLMQFMSVDTVRECRTMIKNNSQSIPVLKNQVLRKRGDHRHTLALETEVHLQKQDLGGMFRCSTQNIGLTGAFLNSDAIPVESSMHVEVVFKSKAKSKTSEATRKRHKQYRLQAEIVHTSEKGAGLVFKIDDQEQQNEFRRFLFKAKVAARH